MSENRLVTRLLNYWQRLKNDEPMPDFRKNNPSMIEDLWGQCFVVAVTAPNSTAYKYVYLGDKIRKIYGGDMDGVIVDIHDRKFPNSVIAPLLKQIKSDSDISDAREYSGNVLSPDGKLIKYRTILLPFGNKKLGLTHIVCGFSYREF